jgi:hypothetical protein
MHKFVRPKIAAKFHAKVRLARTAVRSDIKKGNAPVFDSHWGPFKTSFTRAQFGKCGYCEGRVHGLQYGDVEHYRPKGAVEILDKHNPLSWGVEKPWSSSVEGRTMKLHSHTGYWWKVYSWSNYLLACEVCNQQWKKCLFPVKSRIKGQAPKLQDLEAALLINPFSDIDPGKHLKFGRMGEVSAFDDSLYGHATILTCGLDRPSLRHARFGLARTTHERIDEISGDITERHLLTLLRGIHDDGQDSRPHCGMVRSIFCQRMELEWGELRDIISKLIKTSSRKPRRLCDC